MGSSESKARQKASETEQEVDQMMMVLGNKLEAMENGIKAARGTASEVKDIEVAGGGTIMRVSQIRVATSTAPDQQILDGLNDFFSAAENGVEGENGNAKHAAIKGAQKLLVSGINALMGVENGQSMEQDKFIILFLNNAFVRVDYRIYSYSISGNISVQFGEFTIIELIVLPSMQPKHGELKRTKPVSAMWLTCLCWICQLCSRARLTFWCPKPWRSHPVTWTISCK